LTASLLKKAIEEDSSEAIIAHFPNRELLNAVAAGRARSMAILANSYNRTGVRSFFGKRKVVSLLNDSRFELVSNHCIPATQHLARIGVKAEKLIAWDIPHPFEPSTVNVKKLTGRPRFEAVYAGSIIEGKGITDLIRALALLRKEGIEVHCSLAGLGDIEAMQALGLKHGVCDLLSFVKLVGNVEVFRMMADADLVVVPSRTEYAEGFPLTMFEAIASRTPIVCSDHPMFRSVMFDGINASVFRAGDYRAFAAAIKKTLTDPALYAALSANATATWKALKGPADWRTMIVKWVTEGPASPWIRAHKLTPERV
jgi:glycosyltransferase involved in cell wall biosynthesis